MEKWWRGRRVDGPGYDRAMGVRRPPPPTRRRDIRRRWPSLRRGFRRLRRLAGWALLIAAAAYAVPLAIHLAKQAPIAIAHRTTVDDYRAMAACPERLPNVVRFLTRDDFEAQGEELVDQLCVEGAFSIADAPDVKSRPLQAIAPRYEVAELERLVHELVNLKRTQGGPPALASDAALSAVARGHSEDMAAQGGYFDHESSAGLSPSDRAEEAGYRCRKDYDTYYTEGIAENIYQGWLYGSTTYVLPVPIGVKDYLSPRAIAAGAADGWMDSPGHRENILNPAYDRVGTGVAIAQDEHVLIIQNFC